ncbi:MAG: prolyl oligopeptidase family serine peptidase [Verrucomicrobiota bacterium]
MIRLSIYLLCFSAFLGAHAEDSVNADRMASMDEMLWAEEVEGAQALAWVRKHSDRSLADLQADPRYQGLESDAKEILTSQERIPYGSVRDGFVYNFWQDATHVRGLWRRTPVDQYANEEPEWETVLDLDQLAKDEGKNWVFKGAQSFKPKGSDHYMYLISLSDGGKDAVVNREFEMASKSFIEDGFETPEAKQDAAWLDRNTVLIATDWGEGSLTDSGYPMIVKRWERGTPLETAVELFRGQQTDVGVSPLVIEFEDGTVVPCAVESDTFFTSTYWHFSEDGNSVEWPLPQKSDFEGLYQDWMLIALREDWIPKGQDIALKAGDLCAFDFRAFWESGILPEVSLVFRPQKTQAVNRVAITKGAALLSINENVTSKLLRLERSGSDWAHDEIRLPGEGTAYVVFADKNEDSVFVGYDDFLTPDSVLKYDAKSGDVASLKKIPEKFEADGLVVEQHFVSSKDGTAVPYFIVRKQEIPFNGSTPTLLYGYGGFQISMRPHYRATVGKLWLENGGAYVLANIRGGGEFGPDWHQAGLKTHRQRIYDDFIAIAEDLIERKVTRPDKLGIMGGSNGGLLMGVMLNQRPDLWNAVVVQVPLLDMLRYHLLLAGASWVDEYGSPEQPEERAFLEKISPVHNFAPKEKKYPTPFFVTSTKDDRVHPGHARKMGALFEEAGLPFYYYENIDGGHSAAANQVERAKRIALEYTYLMKQLF